MKTAAIWISGVAAAAGVWCSAPAGGGTSGDRTSSDRPWCATWETSPVGLPTLTKIGSYEVPPSASFRGTIRYRLRIAQGGDQVRLRLSNEYGAAPLSVGSASVGSASAGLDAAHGSLMPVTFGGKSSITIPSGAPALSDPIDLAVKPLGDLIVSVYAPGGVPTFECTTDDAPSDRAGVQNADATRAEHWPASRCVSVRPTVSEIHVRSGRPCRVLVALGDSITDGSVDPESGERGWPGALARRLAGTGISVVNAGIAGNRLLQTLPMFGAAALARLDREVFAVPGLTQILLLEGINDIGLSGPGGLLGDSPQVEAPELIAAYAQIVARAHERGIKVHGATLLPFQGSEYYSDEREKIRSAVNRWIRTSNTFDGIADFDALMRDPAEPLKLKRDYDVGDHLHPNGLGYRRMGEAIDLRLVD